MTMLLNIGASVTSIFGPLILDNLAPGRKDHASLLSVPFGAMQLIVILFSSYLAHRVKLKGAILIVFVFPVVAGLAILYLVPRQASNRATLLAGYYLIASLFGGNPLIVTWIVGNTAGTTKKSVVMGVYNAASSAGNIIGPLLFRDEDGPTYLPGLRASLGVFVALVVVVLLQLATLTGLNRLQERRRVRNGKIAKPFDASMSWTQGGHGNISVGILGDSNAQLPAEHQLGPGALADLTDRENEDFIYIY